MISPRREENALCHHIMILFIRPQVQMKLEEVEMNNCYCHNNIDSSSIHTMLFGKILTTLIQPRQADMLVLDR